MAHSRIRGLHLTLLLSAAGSGAAALVAGPAVHASDGAAPPPRPALSAALMRACGASGMVNIAQAALGQPRETGPATPEAALAELANALGMALPAGALQRTSALSDDEAVVSGPAVVGHAIRRGSHWQADYLATCAAVAVPNMPVPTLPPALSGPSADLPDAGPAPR